jgi:hypothetical protein
MRRSRFQPFFRNDDELSQFWLKNCKKYRTLSHSEIVLLIYLAIIYPYHVATVCIFVPFQILTE